jgi:hypothetical protein
MPVLAACPCESTQFALPVWKAARIRPSAAIPEFLWQSRQKRSVLWHDWQSAAAPNTSTAWRSTKLSAWNRLESDAA